jgi:hypothetical protein
VVLNFLVVGGLYSSRMFSQTIQILPTLHSDIFTSTSWISVICAGHCLLDFPDPLSAHCRRQFYSQEAGLCGPYHLRSLGGGDMGNQLRELEERGQGFLHPTALWQWLPSSTEEEVQCLAYLSSAARLLGKHSSCLSPSEDKSRNSFRHHQALGSSQTR